MTTKNDDLFPSDEVNVSPHHNNKGKTRQTTEQQQQQQQYDVTRDDNTTPAFFSAIGQAHDRHTVWHGIITSTPSTLKIME
jgi:hypothetical protein